MYLLCLAYITAAAIANLLIWWLGPWSAPWIGFIFIGLDLTSRDRLHEMWEGKDLWVKLLLLISAGSCLSYLLCPDSQRIAAASGLAFLVSGAVDSVVYTYMPTGHPQNHPLNRLIRSNGSNLASGLFDSTCFILAGFYPIPAGEALGIIALTWGSKVLGGFIWSLILYRRQYVHAREDVQVRGVSPATKP